MIKKKAKSKGSKKTARKRGARSKKVYDPAEVRKDIAQLVDAEAANMAKAAIEDGKKGQLSTLKFLFEVADIFPAPATDVNAESKRQLEEDSLAKTLLDRLGLPDEPIAQDDEDDLMVLRARNAETAQPSEQDSSTSSGQDAGQSFSENSSASDAAADIRATSSQSVSQSVNERNPD